MTIATDNDILAGFRGKGIVIRPVAGHFAVSIKGSNEIRFDTRTGVEMFVITAGA